MYYMYYTVYTYLQVILVLYILCIISHHHAGQLLIFPNVSGHCHPDARPCYTLLTLPNND